jgi:hypothetical protein
VVSDAIARRKAIYEELHPETKAGVAGAAARWGDGDAVLKYGIASDSFVKATAKAIGNGKSAISAAAARGKALGDSLKDITGTSLDSGVELDALARANSAAICSDDHSLLGSSFL